jgi:hypothetical protein
MDTDVLAAEALLTALPPAHAAHAAHLHALPAAHAHVHHRHGSFSGHVLPGSFFLLWGVWWCLTASAEWHQRARSARGDAVAFRARPWWPLAPHKGSSAWWVMLEPRLKALLPLAGVVVELWCGARSPIPSQTRASCTNLHRVGAPACICLLSCKLTFAVAAVCVRQVPPGQRVFPARRR